MCGIVSSRGLLDLIVLGTEYSRPKEGLHKASAECQLEIELLLRRTPRLSPLEYSVTTGLGTIITLKQGLGNLKGSTSVAEDLSPWFRSAGFSLPVSLGAWSLRSVEL